MKIFSTLKKQATSFLDQYKQQSPATYAAAQQAIGAVLITDGFIGIDNPLGGKKRPGIFGTVVGMIVGIIFMLIPMFGGKLTGISNMTAKTSATVVSVGAPSYSSSSSNSNRSSSPSCPMTVKYSVDGKEYTQQSSISSSSQCSMTAGETITIDYDPNKPGSWAYDTKTIGIIFWVFFVAGVFALISSIVTFVIRLLSIIFGWKMVKDGRKLAATLPQGIDLQTIINEIKQHFIGTVFNAGGGGAANMGGIGGIGNMVSSMTNPTTQPPAQPTPPVQPTPPTQPPVQPTQTPPVSNETPSPAIPPTSEPTTPPEEPESKI